MKINRSFGFILLVLVASFVFIAVPAFAQTQSVIYGVVFDDVDQDGVRDDGEVGVAGVTVTLDGVNQSFTASAGNYSFTNVSLGAHTVGLTAPVGYIATTPTTVNLYTTSGNGYQVDFGIRKVGQVYGFVFSDANANGQQDAGEGG